MVEIFNQLIKFCCNLTDPASKTKSIGLPADPAFGEGRRAGALPAYRQVGFLLANWTILS
jgi:hypothetical protein